MKIKNAQSSTAAGKQINSRFESCTIVIPLMNETASLRYVIETVFKTAQDDVSEVLIVVCHKTTADSMAECHALQKQYPGKIKILWQQLPFLGGALREGFAAAQGSHVIAMYSDAESEPLHVSNLIAAAKKSPAAIISASRWLNRRSFENYGSKKLFLNFIFQKVFSIMFLTNITDFTFGYRIYPLPILQAIQWRELKHAFVLESIIKPLRLSVEVKEIPTHWKARSEGESQLRFSTYLRYPLLGLLVRFTRKKRFLKDAGSLKDILIK